MINRELIKNDKGEIIERTIVESKIDVCNMLFQSACDILEAKKQMDSTIAQSKDLFVKLEISDEIFDALLSQVLNAEEITEQGIIEVLKPLGVV